MARSVTFNGQTQFRAGGISKVDATALTPIGASATGIIALIGEADGGTPGEIIDIDDPALAKDTFVSGPLADAIRVAFDPSNDPRVPGGAFRVRCYKTNASTQAGIQLPGDGTLILLNSQADSTTTDLHVQETLVASEHVGRWIYSGGELRRVVSNTTSHIIVTPALTSAPALNDDIIVRSSQIEITSSQYGTDTNSIAVEFEAGVTTNKYVLTVTQGDTTEQSDEILGTPKLLMKYVGGATVVTGTGPVTACTTSVVTVNGTGAPGLNALAGMVLVLPDGKQRLIASNTNADPTAITLSAGHFLTANQATALVGQNVTTKNVTAASVTISGANGLATGMTSTVTPVGDDVAITFETNPNQTLQDLIDQINDTTNFEATLGDGVNGQTTYMKDFDFGTASTSVDCRFDVLISPTTKGHFRTDLQDLVDYINDNSALITAEKANTDSTEGSEIPQATGGVYGTVKDVPVYLVGGTRGISETSDWQDGFDELLTVRCNHVVPLISEDQANLGQGSTGDFSSIAAQLASHIDLANSTGKEERAGYLGMVGTRTELISQAASYNNPDLQVSGQQITALNVDGDLTEYPEWGFAVQLAGMRSGVPEVGESLTFKLIKTNGLTQDSSWNPRAVGDANALIAGGVVFAEVTPNGTYRVVRDISSWVSDDNIAYMEAGTRDAVRYVSYDLRTSIENNFTGLKAKPATVASVREFVTAKMGVYREQNIIVDSLDPETQTTTIPGYRRLRVSINGNVMSIRSEIFPCVNVTFSLLTLVLQNVILSG